MRSSLPLLFAFLLILTARQGFGEDVKFPNFLPNVDIVYSANVFGEIEPCGCRAKPLGGVDRRWNWIEDKVKLKERLSLDSGDLFYESDTIPIFKINQWNAKAQALVVAYNQFKLDAFTPGELDFAAGLPQFLELKKKAKFKMLSANILYKKDKKPLLDPYVILEKGGKKVGIFGLYNEKLVLPDELQATDHIKVAKKMVTELKKKADVIIALTHLGVEKDKVLAKKVSGIHAIFGSHSQSFLTTPILVGKTVIFQPSLRGQHMGLYSNGKHFMYELDERFISVKGKPNRMNKLIDRTNLNIARINENVENELGLEKANIESAQVDRYQTFPQCASCHKTQYNFNKKTPHMKAYQVLVKAKQNKNFDCLECHTVGMQKPGGFTHVDKVVLDLEGKPVDAIRFARELPKMNIDQLSTVKKAFINVQCENCHGPGEDHPMGKEFSKKVATNKCLLCHTPERAPKWYEKGKLNKELVKKKMKAVSCPAD